MPHTFLETQANVLTHPRRTQGSTDVPHHHSPRLPACGFICTEWANPAQEGMSSRPREEAAGLQAYRPAMRGETERNPWPHGEEKHRQTPGVTATQKPTGAGTFRMRPPGVQSEVFPPTCGLILPTLCFEQVTHSRGLGGPRKSLPTGNLCGSSTGGRKRVTRPSCCSPKPVAPRRVRVSSPGQCCRWQLSGVRGGWCVCSKAEIQPGQCLYHFHTEQAMPG